MTLLRTMFLCLMLLIGVSIRAHATDTAAKPRIALVTKSLANEFFQTMLAAAAAHQRAHSGDYELLTAGIKDEIDTAGQIRLIEQMLARRINALIVAPADSKALVPVLQAALSRGVLVINIDNRLDAKALAEKHVKVPFVGPDNRAGAKQLGDYLAKRLTVPGKVAIIEGVPTTENARQRTLGYRDAMTEAGLTIVTVQSGEWMLQKSNTVAAAILREHPDLLAFLCGNDTMALGVAAAARSAGKLKRVEIVGYDNIPAVKPMLRDGRLLATVDQFPGDQVVSAIEIALRALANSTPQSQLPASVNTRIALVTQ